jgi:hypothetical protein
VLRSLFAREIRRAAGQDASARNRVSNLFHTKHDVSEQVPTRGSVTERAGLDVTLSAGFHAPDKLNRISSVLYERHIG